MIRLVAFGFILIALWITTSILFPNSPFNLLPDSNPSRVWNDNKVKDENLSPQCQELRTALQESKIEFTFSTITIQYQEDELKNDARVTDIRNCIFQDPNAEMNIEFEFFTSKEGPQNSDDLIAQVSVTNSKNKNKIFEYGLRYLEKLNVEGN